MTRRWTSQTRDTLRRKQIWFFVYWL